ncbi:MAG: M24 family metallopeptidase [Acetivibrionales bacterium]|jgi:Xaa-Pro aminopeptidase
MQQHSGQLIRKRMDNFRYRLRQTGCDAALVLQKENYTYLSGFTGTSANLLITHNEAFLLTDFRYVQQASLQAPLYNIVQYKGDIMPVINDIINESGVRNLGFEDNHMTFDTYLRFVEKLETVELVPLKGIIEELRMIKDEDEIDTIRRAARIADKAFSYILPFLKPDVSEIEIAAELEYFMKKKGAEGASFQTIVASGERSALPHGVASEKKLEKGDAITLDYGAIYKGYCSDMTRTVFLGKPHEELEKIYNIVLEAQLIGLEKACAGRTGKDIDNESRDVIKFAGYGDFFGHGLGHGVGLNIHERPKLSPNSTEVVNNGMVTTIEPGIYLKGLGGIRIEDMIVINDDKPLVLTGSSKELIIL